MNSVVIVPDTNIIAINRGTADNLDNSIIYRDKDCKLHKIDLKSCAENFQAKNTLYSGNYVGERKIDNYFFLLYSVFFIISFTCMCNKLDHENGTKFIAGFQTLF